MSDRQGMSIEGIVAVRDNQPYVVIFFGAIRVQLTIADARNVAGDIVQMAARTEADAMIFKFFNRAEFPEGAAIALMKDFRDFRAELDAEPVDKSSSEPTGGQGIQ